MSDFRELNIYKKATGFQRTCLEILKRKNLELYVTDQFARASLSVVLNLTEGLSRFSTAGQRNFFIISRGSLFECIALLEFLNGSGKISEVEFQSAVAQADELSRMLYAMIRKK